MEPEVTVTNENESPVENLSMNFVISNVVSSQLHPSEFAIDPSGWDQSELDQSEIDPAESDPTEYEMASSQIQYTSPNEEVPSTMEPLDLVISNVTSSELDAFDMAYFESQSTFADDDEETTQKPSMEFFTSEYYSSETEETSVDKEQAPAEDSSMNLAILDMGCSSEWQPSESTIESASFDLTSLGNQNILADAAEMQEDQLSMQQGVSTEDLPGLASSEFDMAASRSISTELVTPPLSQSTSSDDTQSLLTLNNYCVYEVFDYLSLDDLCMLTKVCDKLRLLAKDQFERKYPFKWIHWAKDVADKPERAALEELTFSPDEYNYLLLRGVQRCDVFGALQRLFKIFVENVADYKRWFENIRFAEDERLMPTENYVMHFYQNIKSVIIETGRQKDAFQFLYSMRTEQDNSGFAQIQFKSTVFKKPLSQQASNILKEVPTIGFWQCIIKKTFYDYVLKHCESMKNLIVHRLTEYNDTQWMLQTYPMLEHFQLSSKYKSSYEKLPQFLQLNPTIKSLTWYFDGYYIDEIVVTIRAIVRHGVALEELFLSFNNTKCEKVNMVDICDELEALCERKTFKRIELDFGLYSQQPFLNTEKLMSLSKLSGLHYMPSKVCFNSLQNVKILHLHRGYDSGDIARLAHLENLEELIWDDYYCKCDVADYVTPFVRSSAKLKKIIVNTKNVSDEQGQILMWNFWREKSASQTTIYFRKEVLKTLKKLLFVGIHAGEDMVKVKLVVMVEDVLNVNNPFIKFSCEEI